MLKPVLPFLAAAASILGVFLGGPPAGPTTRIPPEGVLVATAAGSVVRVQALRGDDVVELYAVDLGAPITNIEWADARTVAALREDGRVAHVSGAEIIATTTWPAQSWQVPPRTPATEEVRVGFPDARDRLVRAVDGTVWLKHCTSAYEGDADPCAAWAHGRVAPPGPVQTRKPTVEPPRRPVGSPAAGFRIVTTEEGGGVRLDCRGPNGQQSSLPFEDEPCAVTLTVHWLAPHSRHLVVEAETDCGEAATVRYVLLQACAPAPAATLEAVEWGPAGLWAHPSLGDAEPGWTIRRDSKEIGRVVGASLLRFR